MKKTWKDPVKGQPATPETLNTPGDFGAFSVLMSKIIEKPKPTASRVPAGS